MTLHFASNSFLWDEAIISLIIITPGPFWYKNISSSYEHRSYPRSAWYSSTLKMESARRSEVWSPIRKYFPDLYSNPEVGFPDSGYTWYYRATLPPELANGLSSSWTNVPPAALTFWSLLGAAGCEPFTKSNLPWNLREWASNLNAPTVWSGERVSKSCVSALKKSAYIKR